MAKAQKRKATVKAAKPKKETPPEIDESALPLIPLASKKASKADSPLEKEIRRFNRLVKQLQEQEAAAAREKEAEERYEQLYRQKVVPELARLAAAKYRFLQTAHPIFKEGKFTKDEQRAFVHVAATMLQEIVEYLPEATELLHHYTNLKVQLMPKREKEQLDRLMEEEGFGPGFTKGFDSRKKWEEGKQQFEERFARAHEEAFEERKEAHLESKKAALEHADINALYRELAKLLHPDLEQDETIRTEKEHLMKELVQARNNRDLHALLLIRSKAQRFRTASGQEPKDATYTLEQLKRYNKELKERLDEKQYKFSMENLEFMLFGDVGGKEKHLDPEADVKRELREIKRELKEIEQEIKMIRTPAELKEFIEVQRMYSRLF
ncbi:hypothetical protein V9K67_09335 [Paraflavisolibacter sp. H34]|uniref:hypothetical protein n=1 Tax=Huijunlia imazamoxiresistens TaxID=3127457 RepID=UPI00301A2DAB